MIGNLGSTNEQRSTGKTLQVYKFILMSGVPFFPFYGLIFLYAGKTLLFLTTFIFSAVCIACLMEKPLRVNRAMMLAHVQVVAIIILVVSQAGWDYGIQYIIFATVALSYLGHYKFSTISILLVFLETFTFIVLYFLFEGQPPVILMPDYLIKAYFILSVITGVAVTVVAGRKSQISNYVYSNIILEENMALREMVHTDALTMVYNRRAMQDMLENSWDDYINKDYKFWVIMCDVDMFKDINDTHGHDAGDGALKHIADCISKNLRDTDRVSRWGGDEFLILIGNVTDKDIVRNLLTRISTNINDDIFTYEGEPVNITMTFGCALCTNHASLRELTLRADMNLYEGKSNKRDQIVF